MPRWARPSSTPLSTTYAGSIETNFYGPLLLTRAFVPVIERNGGGHLLNVHSVLSWIALGGSYSASKAALWSQTNSLRLELQPRGIAVTGLHVGYVDTVLTTGVDAPKSDPRRVMLEAKRRVASSDEPAVRVAAHIGFSSATNFSKNFRSRAGQSPIQFWNASRQVPRLQGET